MKHNPNTKGFIESQQMFSQLIRMFGSKPFLYAEAKGIVNDNSKTVYLSLAARSGVVTKLGRGKYQIPVNSVPENMARIIQKYGNKLSAKSHRKVKKSSLPSQPKTELHVPSVETCISVLKSNGYKVMKPVAEYVEV